MKILLLLTLTLVGCKSLSGDIEQQINDKIGAAKESMVAEIQKAKENYTAQYLAALEKQSDSLNRRKLQNLNASIINTSKYLDSLNTEIDELDLKGVNNTQLVRIAFLYKGAADSWSEHVDLWIPDRIV